MASRIIRSGTVLHLNITKRPDNSVIHDSRPTSGLVGEYHDCVRAEGEGGDLSVAAGVRVDVWRDALLVS